MRPQHTVVSSAVMRGRTFPHPHTHSVLTEPVAFRWVRLASRVCGLFLSDTVGFAIEYWAHASSASAAIRRSVVMFIVFVMRLTYHTREGRQRMSCAGGM